MFDVPHKIGNKCFLSQEDQITANSDFDRNIPCCVTCIQYQCLSPVCHHLEAISPKLTELLFLESEAELSMKTNLSTWWCETDAGNPERKSIILILAPFSLTVLNCILPTFSSETHFDNNTNNTSKQNIILSSTITSHQ